LDVAVVVHVGCGVSDDAESVLTKPLYNALIPGTAELEVMLALLAVIVSGAGPTVVIPEV
jgi:homoserine kinase